MICESFKECYENKQGIYARCGECCIESNEQNITRRERGKRYNLQNPNRHTVSVFRVDGGVVYNDHQAKCDYLYVVKDEQRKIAIYVELKGVDLAHAFEQIEASVNMFHNTLSDTKQLARIVCKSVPKILNDKDKLEFRKRLKKQGIELAVCEMNMDDKILC